MAAAARARVAAARAAVARAVGATVVVAKPVEAEEVDGAHAPAEKLPAQVGACASDGHARRTAYLSGRERTRQAAHLNAVDDEPVVGTALLPRSDDLVPLAVVVARGRDDAQRLAGGRRVGVDTHDDLTAADGEAKVGGADGGVDGVAAVPAAGVAVSAAARGASVVAVAVRELTVATVAIGAATLGGIHGEEGRPCRLAVGVTLLQARDDLPWHDRCEVGAREAIREAAGVLVRLRVRLCRDQAAPTPPVALAAARVRELYEECEGEVGGHSRHRRADEGAGRRGELECPRDGVERGLVHGAARAAGRRSTVSFVKVQQQELEGGGGRRRWRRGWWWWR
eukprot:scaffold72006_cov101-Phaeocystis_antarctica.AAC.1